MFPVRDKLGYRQEHLCKYRLVFVLFRFRFRVVYVFYSWDTTASAVEVVVVEAVVFTNMFPGGLYLRHVQEHDCKCLVVLWTK